MRIIDKLMMSMVVHERTTGKFPTRIQLPAEMRDKLRDEITDAQGWWRFEEPPFLFRGIPVEVGSTMEIF